MRDRIDDATRMQLIYLGRKASNLGAKRDLGRIDGSRERKSHDLADRTPLAELLNWRRTGRLLCRCGNIARRLAQGAALLAGRDHDAERLAVAPQVFGSPRCTSARRSHNEAFGVAVTVVTRSG